MKWTSLFLAHLSLIIRRPWQLFFILAAAALALAAGLQGMETRSDRFLVAVVNEDKGDYGQKMISAIKDLPAIDLITLTRGEAFTLLRNDRIEGVFVIRPDYTERLRAGEFARLVEWYTAPSSRAAATVSEPLITETMRLWMEELAVIHTRRFLAEAGLGYSAEQEAYQRSLIRATWLIPADVEVRALQRDGTGRPAENDSPLPGTAGLLDDCIRWYAVFCVFYLMISASWVLDINKRGLRVRAIQAGGRLWQILLGVSLAPLLLGLAGFWLTGAAASLIGGGSWLRLAVLAVPFMIYLWTVMSMTIFLASFVRQSFSLMFLAPMLTFVNALMSGMITSLPDWAAVLAIISRGLPGRWLMEFFSSPLQASLLALFCGACWFLAGIAVSERRQASGQVKS